MLFYTGTDPQIIQRIGTQEKPLIQLATTNPRRTSQLEYVTRYCIVEKIDDSIKVLNFKVSEVVRFQNSRETYDKCTFTRCTMSVLRVNVHLSYVSLEF